MARKVMRTIADRKNEISNELLSTQPMLTDDFTYGTMNQTKDIIADRIMDEDKMEDINEELVMEENIIQPSDTTRRESSPLEECACGIGEHSAKMLRKEQEELSERYPVQNAVSTNQPVEYTVDEIQDSVDEINPDSGTRERG